MYRKPTIQRHLWSPATPAFRAALTLVVALATCAVVFPAPALDDYGGWTEVSRPATGFFTVETLRDRWWFITPAGNAFLAKAVEVVEPCGGRTSAAVRQQIAGWGFNTIGPRCPDDLRREGMPYTVLLNLSGPTMDAGAAVPGRRFPDVFDPRFERIATEIAGTVCSLHADSKWLLGYFTDDALDWRTDGPGDLVDAFLAMPADAPGKQAVVAEIRRLYTDNVKDFNTAWGVSLASFDQLLGMSDLKPGAKFQGYAVSRDRAALETLIAGRYFQVAGAAIKAHDPNHLSLGCRFSRPPSREVLAAMTNRMNVASIAASPDLTPDVLTQMHSDSGSPLLVCGEGAAEPATASPIDAARAERDGSAFEKRVEALAKQAFVVGYAWPRYRASDPASANDPPGLVNAQGDPDEPLVDRVAKTNQEFHSQASYARLKPTLFDIVPRYELRRAGSSGIGIDGDLRDWASAMAMELRPSAYEVAARGIEASAYLMWDAGAVYVAGRVYDPSVEASTVTSYVGPDWIELGVAIYSFRVTLQPGYQIVTDVRKNRTKPASVVIGRILAQPESGAGDAPRRVAGYTFEGTVPVSGPVPEGFVTRFGLAMHHYTKDGREVRLSFPYYWWPANPSSAADIIITGRAAE